jgi:hypothetical protein
MSSVVKTILGLVLVLLPGLASARDIYVLVVGDQSAANCHSRMYGPVEGVYLLGEDGKERQAADPLTWSDCRAGSIWMPVAARLKQQPGVDKVVLLPVAVNGATAEDFNIGAAAARLSAALTAAKLRHIRFDYALWQQSMPDRSTPGNLYMNQMRKVIKSASLKITIDRWLVGSEGCSDTPLSDVARAQVKLAKQVLLNRFPGPIDVRLDSHAQLPDCRLTAVGQETMARYWFNAIRRADQLDRHYEHEALISLFK